METNIIKIYIYNYFDNINKGIKMKRREKINILKPFSFKFNIGDIKFELFLSSISGSEKLVINGEEVSNKRTYSKISKHETIIDGNKYLIEINCENSRKGPWYCSLYKDNILVEKQQLTFVMEERTWKSFLSKSLLILVFIIGILFISVYLDSSLIAGIGTGIFVFLLLIPKYYLEFEIIPIKNQN